jgi:hypothetical protein
MAESASVRARRRSEDPAAALVTVAGLMFGPVPPKGTRHEALTELAFRAAEAGQTNDWILTTLNVAADLWYGPQGVYDRWTRLLSLLRLARRAYPNDRDGNGWRPEGTDG